MEQSHRPSPLTILVLAFSCVALLAITTDVYSATIQITSGQIAAGNASDFLGNGLLTGPGFSMRVAGNAAGCGPCAFVDAPALPLPLQGGGNLVSVSIFGQGPPGPFQPPPSDFSYQGDPYAISNRAFWSVNSSPVTITTNPFVTPFTLSGTFRGQNLRTAALVDFDINGSGTMTVSLFGISPIVGPGPIGGISLAFQAVPEPSTWLLLGSGLVTLIMQRQFVRQAYLRFHLLSFRTPVFRFCTAIVGDRKAALH